MYVRTLIFWLVLHVTWREISSDNLLEKPEQHPKPNDNLKSTYSKHDGILTHPKSDGKI